MRPVRLELRGFGAFRELVEIDFEDTDFFALVGPTGSGKSTVIDAICFALYGKVPRLGSSAASGTITSLGAAETVVRLTFDAGGARYVVARIVRLGRTKEVRLERLHDDLTTTIAAQARETDRAVEAVVGLTFEHFTRCVVLPQGEFARFLHDEPKDRRALLVRLLGLGLYETMRKRADDIARRAGARAAVLGEQVASTSVLDETAEALLRERATALAALEADLADVVDAITVVRSQIDERDRSIARLAAACNALDAVVVPKDAADLGVEQQRATSAAVELQMQAVAAVGARDGVRAARSVHPPLVSLTDLLALHERVTKGHAVVAERAAHLAAATTHELETERALAGAEEALGSARNELEASVRAHAAHELASHLVVGEPCPVCEQPVLARPTAATPAGLRGAEQSVGAAERAVERARRSHRAVAAQRSDAVARLAQAEGQLVTLTAQLEGRPSPDELRTQVRLIEVLDRELAVAEATAAAAEVAVTTAEQRAQQLAARVAALAGQLHRQRDPVASLDPPAPTTDLVGSWHQLAAWAQHEAIEQRARLGEAEDARAQLRAARAAIEDRAIEAAAAVGIRAGSTADLRAAIARAAAETEARLRNAQEDRARAARLAAERDELHASAAVAALLALHLRSDRFQDWLVTESLDVLAEAASGLLHRLSGGQFSLRYDGNEFAVVDHRNGDEQRPARTLSGGETFQASLALALALADHIAGMGAGGAAALDAIFLDEGFGTLDADSLETVAGTIESLGTDGRMVGIVTHVRELAERVPVRYVVTKGARTSTVERVAG